MPTPSKYLAIFEADTYYHVYNHASGRENLFIKQENYLFFLNKLNEHLGDYVELNAFCLMPNHFHILIRVKHLSELSPETTQYLEKFETLNACICRKFNNFFIAYSLAFNKQQNRQGNLFRKPFKRILVNNEAYFARLIQYIHFNPIHHGFVKKISDYKWTSYEGFIVEKPTKLPRQKILDWFNGKTSFIKFHEQADEMQFKEIENWLIEEDN